MLETYQCGSMVEQTCESINKWIDISQISEDSKSVNIRFLVLERKEPRYVLSKSSGRRHELVEFIVTDSTARINLVLWNDDADSVNLQNTYTLTNGHVNIYNECMSISKGRFGEIKHSSFIIECVDREKDMSKPFMGRPKRRMKPRSKTGRTFDGSAGREIRKFSGRKSF